MKISIVVALCAFLVLITGSFTNFGAPAKDNKCCELKAPLERCSDCVGVDDDGNGVLDEDYEYYIQAPDTPGYRCKTYALPSQCDEELRICGSAGPVVTYTDNWMLGYCNVVRGLEASVSWYAMQCGEDDDLCPGPIDP